MNRNSFIAYVAVRVMFFMALLLVWALCYPCTIAHFEDVAFYADTADCRAIQYQLPRDWLGFVGGYLSQFYFYILAGAAIQSLVPLLVMLIADWALWHVTRCVRALMLSLLPALAVAMMQTGRYSLSHSLGMLVGAAVVAAFIVMMPYRLWHRLLPVHPSSSVRRWMVAAALLAIVAMAVVMCVNRDRRSFEYDAQMERWAAGHEWSKMLDTSYPRRYQLNDMQMAYSLLALSERHRLADKLFTYPVMGVENLFYPNDNNPVQCRFNSFFCASLGLPNEAVRYAFEEGQGEAAGVSFGSTRRMVDWLLQRGGDMRQAAFALGLLARTSCNGDFVKTRRMFLSAARRRQPRRVFFVGSESFVLE
jgi:hypothetical protein